MSQIKKKGEGEREREDRRRAYEPRSLELCHDTYLPYYYASAAIDATTERVIQIRITASTDEKFCQETGLLGR